MFIIFFDIAPAFFAVLLLAIVIVNGASSVILHTIGFLCIVLALRSIFVNIKRINNSGSALRLINILIDIVRVYMFYRLFYTYSFNVHNSVGFAFISSLIDLVIVAIIGGGVFFSSEVVSVLVNPDNGENHQNLKEYTKLNLFCSLVFCLITMLLLFFQ